MQLQGQKRDRVRLGVIVAVIVLGFFAFQRFGPDIDIEQVLTDLSEWLGAWTYLLVGLLAFLETGAFVGLIFPGETAVILGGAVAGQGKTSIVITIAVVWFCAWAGDTTSFYIGRRLGREFILKHGRKVLITPERARDLLQGPSNRSRTVRDLRTVSGNGPGRSLRSSPQIPPVRLTAKVTNLSIPSRPPKCNIVTSRRVTEATDAAQTQRRQAWNSTVETLPIRMASRSGNPNTTWEGARPAAVTVRDSFGQGPIVICHLFRSCRCALSGMNHPRFSRISAASSALFRSSRRGRGAWR